MNLSGGTMRTITTRAKPLALLLLGALGLGLAAEGCGGSGGSGGGGGPTSGVGAPSIEVVKPNDWAADTAAILSEVYADPAGDYETQHPGDAPPLLIPHPPGDATRISWGIEGDFLYLRLDFAAPIPQAPVPVAALGGVGPQTVQGQSVSLVINADNSTSTGGGASPWLEGVDLFVALNLRYGSDNLAYINYDFLDGDLHKHQHQIDGVVGEGGPGTTFVVARYDISSVPTSFLPRGATVGVGSWVESESELFHEMAVDTVLVHQTWLVPE
jgi:hypothetical protein